MVACERSTNQIKNPSAQKATKIKVKLNIPAVQTNSKVHEESKDVSKTSVFDSESDDELQNQDIFQNSDDKLKYNLRMKNIGVKTMTSTGPNTYNKDKYGMTDFRARYTKEREKQIDSMFRNVDKD
ncbi:MAG: hypothetical protein MHMPM18_001043 [Marteilia pararefringens]